MVSKKSRTAVRENKHRRMRHHLAGTAQRPRLAVFRSNNHMYAQIIDDTVGNTLVSASTLDKELKAELEKTNNVDAASKLGTVIAKKALDKGITTVVFDRGGFIYQGKVKALADAVADLCRFDLIIRFYRSDGTDKRVFILYNNAPLVIVELLIVRCPQREDLLCYLYAAVRGPCEELCDPRVGRPIAVHRLCVRKR